MCRVLGITQTRTTAYNPKSDGMVERFNKTLVNMVAVLIDPKRMQKDWDECLPYATFAYRCTPHESTGESPNMMMLGREVSLPIDLLVECGDVEDGIGTDFAESLRQNMRRAHERARQCLGKSAQRQNKDYDRRASDHGLKEGHFMWLFNPAKKRYLTPKLQLRWEGPWLVIKQLSDVTFRIQLKKGGKCKVVHADRLKPYLGRERESWERKDEVMVVESGTPQSIDPLESPSVAEEFFVEETAPATVDSSGEVLEGTTPSIECPPRRYPVRDHRLPVRYR